jgi:surfactin family lipopeptide synthetase A
MFTVMFAAYILMLQRFSQQDDIVCSFISGGREHWALQPVIGFFVQAVPFKIRVSGEETVESFLKRVHDNVLGILKHQDYPLELICEDLDVRFPETSVSFNMLNIQDDTLGRALSSFSPRHGSEEENKEAKFDLEPFIMEYNNGVEINWMYRKEKFLPKTVEFMANEFHRILEFMTRAPGEPVSAARAKKKKKRSLKAVK